MIKDLVQSHSEPTAPAIVHPCGNDAAASASETVIALGSSEHAARLNQPSRKQTHHRWPAAGTAITPNKTERECQNGCGIVKVTRHETEGGRDLHWTEFWRGLDPISDVNGKTPPCTGPATAVKYDARNCPL